jgi:hypothetical protein
MVYVLSVIAVLALLYLFLESYNAFVEARKLGERDARDGAPGRSRADISRYWSAGALKAFLFLVVLLGTPLLFDFLAFWHLPAWVPLSRAYFSAQAAQATQDDPRAKLKQRTDDLENTIRQLEKQHKALSGEVAKLKEDRDTLVAELKKEGVQSAKDAKGKPELERKADRLQKKLQELDYYQGKLSEYAAALDDAQETRKTLDRQRVLADAGIDDKALDEVAAQINILNAKSKPPGSPVLDALRGESALDKALKGKE